MNTKRFRLAAAVALLVTTSSGTPALAQDAAQWSYVGATGPAYWASLSPAFHACGDGLLQSPIDLSMARRGPAAPIRTAYTPSPVTLLHNGETVEVRADHAQTLDIGDRRYAFVQLHFHSPGEHMIAGVHAPLELHFVHQTADENRAVLGVLARTGHANPSFDRLLGSLPRTKGAETRIAAPVDLEQLLPHSRRAYRYAGSLTTPPCTEGIQWLVLKERLEVSSRQLTRLRETVEGNARPAQPLNGRAVTLH